MNGFNISALLTEDSESEFTIIDVHEGILISCSILLDLFAPDVAVLFTTDHLGEGVLIGLKTVHHNMEFPVILFYHCDGSGRVITDDAGHDWELGLHIFRLCQVLEQLCVVVELQVGLQLLIFLLILCLLLVVRALRLIVVVSDILTTCVSSLHVGTSSFIDLNCAIVTCFRGVLLIGRRLAISFIFIAANDFNFVGSAYILKYLRAHF